MNEELDTILNAFAIECVRSAVSDYESKMAIPQAKAQIQRLIVEAKIEQSWRCRELIEANANSPEDEERYGEIVLLDIDDLTDELKEYA